VLDGYISGYLGGEGRHVIEKEGKGDIPYKSKNSREKPKR
jgi:hypothetical protein